MLKKVRRPVKEPEESEEFQTSQKKQEGGNDVMPSNDSTNLVTNVVPFSCHSSSISTEKLSFNAVSTYPQEGWQEAIIQSVESTTPVKTKRGECSRAKLKLFLQGQRINLYQNLLLINSPNSVIMQLIDACIQPDENRQQYNLMNLVNHEVFVRIQKNVKGERTFYNVVEVKPLEANLEGEEG